MIRDIAYHFSFDKIVENEDDFSQQDREWIFNQYIARVFKLSAAIGLAGIPALSLIHI